MNRLNSLLRPPAGWVAVIAVLFPAGMVACGTQAPDREQATVSEALTPLPAQLDCASTRTWVEANKNRLPADYGDVVRYPLAVRQAIFAELPAERKSDLWLSHVKQYRASREHLLSTEQRATLQAVQDAFTPKLFSASPPSAGVRSELDEAKSRLLAAFGKNEAARILATLGPVSESEPAQSQQADCTCSTDDDWCTNELNCREHGCLPSLFGCGSAWLDRCNGRCYEW